ncbi:MAG TPA: dynamin family protein [Myxococcota bacterium]|jgi:tetratricopeptide (TPR) repeat protein|nr:dynamin family protein [Myxococcota bacterium]
MGLFDRLGDRVLETLEKALLPEELKAPLERGKAALAAGDHAAALREFEAAHRAQPQYTQAIALMGVARLGLADAEGAARDLERAVTAGLDDPELVVALGRAYLALGRVAEAKSAFKRAAAKDPRGAAGAAGLGHAYLTEKRYAPAARELRKAAARADPAERPELLALLGDALLRSGKVDEAADALGEAATATSLAPVARARARVALGDAERRRKRWAAAAVAYRDALQAQPDDLAALLGLGGALRGQKDLDGALEAARRARALAPHNAQAANLEGAVRLDQGDARGALDCFRAALEAAPDVAAVLRSATRAALAAADWTQALAYAERLMQLDAADPFAAAARGLALVSAPPPADPAAAAAAREAARAFLRAALSHDEEQPEAHMGLARAALAEGKIEEAAAAAAAALRVDPARADARALIVEVASRDVPPPVGGGDDLAAAASALHVLCAARPALAALAPVVGEQREQLDRPLVLAVLGEFNAGKSTFVNALLGEDVAPMGVTPTTATINLIKYGPERAARAVYRDGRTRDIPFAALKDFFREVGLGAARDVSLVEVMYPIAELMRVNVVDTPGLNSLIEEHEAATRAFIARADAVVWVFDVGQAGKLSEARVLDLVSGHARKTLGVVNKIDRVSDAERAEVLAHVRAELGGRLVDVVPVSARAALQARMAGDEAAVAASGFPALHATLDREFYAPSRELVRAGVRERLRHLIQQGLRAAVEELAACDAALAAIEALRGDLGGRVEALERFAVEEATSIVGRLETVYRLGAKEVLEFVKPRRTLWGAAGPGGPARADVEDRAYLRALIEEKLAGIVDESRRRAEEKVDAHTQEVSRAVRAAVDAGAARRAAGGSGTPVSRTFAALAARAGALVPELGARRAEMSARVFGRYHAFALGWLRGGRLDDFFDEALPRTDLGPDDVYAALRRTMASPLVAAGEEGVAVPLASWAQRWQQELDVRLDDFAGELVAGRLLSEHGTAEPLRALARVLRS